MCIASPGRQTNVEIPQEDIEIFNNSSPYQTNLVLSLVPYEWLMGHLYNLCG
jgi:hypothetical protein